MTFGDATAVEESTHDLVRRIAAGERDAEHRFVQRYERGLAAILRRHCRPNDPELPDLVQEVLLVVLQRLRSGALRDGQALTSYLQTTAAHMASAEYRRRARHERAADTDTPSVAPDPGREWDSRRRAQVVRSLLEGMETTRDREVLRLFYIEERSKDEVCAALAIDHHHFHRVVFRARQRLRQKLEAAGLEPAQGETNELPGAPS
jgi:RNA polymerase sigma-70 factor, ECF subfamily